MFLLRTIRLLVVFCSLLTTINISCVITVASVLEHTLLDTRIILLGERHDDATLPKDLHKTAFDHKKLVLDYIQSLAQTKNSSLLLVECRKPTCDIIKKNLHTPRSTLNELVKLSLINKGFLHNLHILPHDIRDDFVGYIVQTFIDRTHTFIKEKKYSDITTNAIKKTLIKDVRTHLEAKIDAYDRYKKEYAFLGVTLSRYRDTYKKNWLLCQQIMQKDPRLKNTLLYKEMELLASALEQFKTTSLQTFIESFVDFIVPSQTLFEIHTTLERLRIFSRMHALFEFGILSQIVLYQGCYSTCVIFSGAKHSVALATLLQCMNYQLTKHIVHTKENTAIPFSEEQLNNFLVTIKDQQQAKL